MRSWGLRGTPEGPRREVRPKSAGQTHMADESVGKPDSVRSLPTVAIIHLRPLLPAAWCDLPGGSGEQPSNASADARTHPFDLAPSGVYRSTPVTWDAGGLLHRLFTLTSVLKVPGTSSVVGGGLLSVALSRGSPRVGVTHHLALWSPDFPRRRIRDAAIA